MSIIMIMNVDFIYPVGSIYITTSSISPATLFGGTWERYSQGRFLIGYGPGTDWTGTSLTYGTIGDMGGEYLHTLSAGEMPKHWHTVVPYAATGAAGGVTDVYVQGGTGAPTYYGASGNAGNNEPHNNVPPYVVVYMWRRTA